MRCSIHRKAARLLEGITGGCTADYGSRLESSGRRREAKLVLDTIINIHFAYYTGLWPKRLASRRPAGNLFPESRLFSNESAESPKKISWIW
ncbi:MAG: hypothetical protein DRI46_07100 [Chloroflexi bacterium]|nr:MAG: hypothetical protein DRI46_07100 [Chloroflexota bacterium]